MFLIIGSLVVTGCVIGSYVAMGGKLGVLWQPFELVIIGGSGVGAYIIANSKAVLGQTMGGLTSILKGPKYKKDDYLELLSLQYQIFKLAKTKGMLALETHVENPEDSDLFA
jgi:chemotaxis protein MotA